MSLDGYWARWLVGYPDQGTTFVGITFRPAQVADIPALAVIRAAEWETEAYWTRRIGEYLREEGAQDRTILVAEDGETIVGFVAGHRTRRFGCDGELQWVNVAREIRRRGIGAMLVREIGCWFVEQGTRRICVDVEPDNAVARGLYSRCGARSFKPYWMIWENSCDMADQRTSHLDA
jgi:predicted GNAT family acetyltransferase